MKNEKGRTFFIFPVSILLFFTYHLSFPLSLFSSCPFSHVHPQTETGTVQSACRRPAFRSRRTAAICSVVRDSTHTQSHKLIIFLYKVSEQTSFVLSFIHAFLHSIIYETGSFHFSFPLTLAHLSHHHVFMSLLIHSCQSCIHWLISVASVCSSRVSQASASLFSFK